MKTIWVRDKWLYVLLIPGVLYFLIFRYLPMGGVVIAFKNYVPFLGIKDSAWVGFDHFVQFFNSPDFGRLLGNTLWISFLSLAFGFPAPIILAVLLNEVRHSIYKKLVQTSVYIPHFLSWTIVVGLTHLLFSVDGGVIVELVQNIFGVRINFLADPNWFRPLIILQGIWKGAGWGTIIFLAAMSNISSEQYEAAIMDGAGRFRRIWHITLPAIRSTVVIMLILNMGSVLNTGFDQIFLMMNPLNRTVADVFDTYVYNVGITRGSYSYSTAVGLFKSVVGIILILTTDFIAKRVDEDSGLF
ncbi:ABC transporter permease subunit [Amphibacillus sp. MSJ-3]|uniref:ABC transporter permease n=1 Tax=Amphibacillus sp. MSJ-3 TaxID=2841505 RepID=UPI001C0EE918|nr:ABC transporter permease subunit [Amphibacillus sp. MSJ-3]MBU5593812.1 ABC transporter permease subunit [Amphibacillus sp. MSJ-3]